MVPKGAADPPWAPCQSILSDYGQRLSEQTGGPNLNSPIAGALLTSLHAELLISN